MFFSRMENFLEKNIEGFFNRKFSSNLQMAEIEKIIDRILIRQKKRVNRAIFVPDKFTITMSDEDFKQLNNIETQNHLKLFLYKSVIQKDYFMETLPTIHIIKSPKFKLGVCEITAKFNSDKTSDTDNDNVNDLEQGTIIVPNLDIKEITNPSHKQQALNFASLTIIEGPDKDSYLAFGCNQIHLGRRDKNEFLLTDVNVSRLHAYITFEHGRHILRDANSLNGTAVNDRPITNFCLCPGDIIQIGNTRIVYDLI